VYQQINSVKNTADDSVMKYPDTVILLFAKAPVAGKVNTRLIADIGVQAATLLQRDLIAQRLSMLTQANLCAVSLMCSPDVHDDYFVHCKTQYPISLLAQSGEDLGKRMLNGIKQALQQYKYCIVIGTDAPVLDEALISQAIERLKTGAEVVFVPAEDGGYVLVGLQKPYEFLFQGISWGSAEVMQQSRSKLKINGISFDELATCWDIDRLEDYQRYLVFKEAR
jgi:rSAM/selenodomain-associated transferase 1